MSQHKNMRGKKLLTNLICAFIPSKLIRERLRLRASDNQILIIDNGKERKMKLRELKNLKFNFLGESAKNIIKIHKNSNKRCDKRIREQQRNLFWRKCNRQLYDINN